MTLFKALCVTALFVGGALYGQDAAVPGLTLAGGAAVALAIADAASRRTE